MSERPSVIVLDELFTNVEKAVQEEFPELRIMVPASSSDLQRLAVSVDVIVVQKDPVNAALLDTARNLRLLLKMGRVYDNVDVDLVRKRNIPMALSPRKGPNCVAELALTLILSLSKDLIKSHHHVVHGDYRQIGLDPIRTEELRYAFKWMKQQNIHEIRRKTLGIVGMGEIGCELARRANALEMAVLYYKRTPLSPELERRYNVSYSHLHPMLEVSDYVCLAVPLTPSTEHLIGAEELRLIGAKGFLVNVARGAIVDEKALIEALRISTIAGAGLDVFTYEPLPADSPLLTLDNVILTPHIGGGSGSNPALEMGEALAEVESILAGQPMKVPL